MNPDQEKSLEKAHIEIRNLRTSRDRLEREVEFLRDRMNVHEDVLTSRDLRWARTLGAVLVRAEVHAFRAINALRKVVSQ